MKALTKREFIRLVVKPRPLAEARVCDGCNLKRVGAEYQGYGVIYRYCQVCRARGGSKETIQ